MMRLQFFERLPVGGKVYLGFGTATFLFALVIFIYHNTLFQALTDHEQLLANEDRTKNGLLDIHQNLLVARLGERDFLAQREERFVRQVHARLNQILDETEALAALGGRDGGVLRVAEGIRERTLDYRNAFDELAAAWRTKGLDHESGLQGRFRQTIHEVEDKVRNYKIGHLHRTLLEIRRSEKDTGLRRKTEYIDRTLHLVDVFIADVTDSELDESVKRELTSAIQSYRQHYLAFASFVMAGQPLHGGMGAYRDAAHVVESILVRHFVPDFETNLLLLRRWEKDYLLRNDPSYVERLGAVLTTLRASISESQIVDGEKNVLAALLAKYERDFLALVAQNALVAELEARLERDVEEIEALVAESVGKAIAATDRASEETRGYSVRNARIALAIALAALALTIVFAEYITRRITTSLATLMAITRISAAGGGQGAAEDDRDEVKAFARALGGMSRHIANLFAELDRTERELEGVVAELEEASGRLAEEDPAWRSSPAARRVNAAAEMTAGMASRLRARVEALAETAAVQEKMLDRLKARAR